MVEYESFEDVLGDLDIEETDLKRLVSEGALRAYRDEDRMKFRKDDIEALRLSGGRLESFSKGVRERGDSDAEIPTLSDADELEIIEETDETMLDIGDLSDDVDFEDTGATSVPTVELDLGDEMDATLTDELVFEDLDGDDGGLGDADATLAMDDGLSLDDDDDLGLETEPLADLEDADATMLESGDDISLSADDEITLTGDDDLDMEGGSAVQTGMGQASSVGQTSIGSYATMAPPPMVAPQVQLQEKTKYVEILPSEPVWTKIVAAFFLVFMLIGALAVVGTQSKDDAMGVASSIGYGMSYKPAAMKDSPDTRDLGLRPMSGDKPIEPGDPQYASPQHWLVTVNPSRQAVAPGMEVVRKTGGTFGAGGPEEFNGQEVRVTPEIMQQEYTEKGDVLDKLRRSNLMPGSRSPSAPSPAQ